MKNIVPRTDANDAFSKRLNKRLHYVLKPLLLQREAEERLKDERSQFDRLPQDSKIGLLTTKAVALLMARSFSIQAPKDGTGFKRGATLASSAFAYRVTGKRRQEVGVIARHPQ